jgi:hypothetical protein
VSIEAEANTNPVNPPTVNKYKKPTTQTIEGLIFQFIPYIVANQEKIFTPVGTPITIVAAVK